MNATRHVVIALALTAILFVVAGDRWNERIGALRPVDVAKRGA